MAKRALTEFGKEVKLELILRNESQKWLIDELHKRCDHYVDCGLMHKLLTGQRHSKRLEKEIRGILGIPDPTSKESKISAYQEGTSK